LSTEKATELETLHRSLRDKRQANCVKVVIALPKGWSTAQIAEILLLDEKTLKIILNVISNMASMRC